jgi:hypothetical protein
MGYSWPPKFTGKVSFKSRNLRRRLRIGQTFTLLASWKSPRVLMLAGWGAITGTKEDSRQQTDHSRCFTPDNDARALARAVQLAYSLSLPSYSKRRRWNLLFYLD